MINSENVKTISKIVIVSIILLFMIILNIMIPKTKTPIQFEFHGNHPLSDNSILDDNKTSFLIKTKIENKSNFIDRKQLQCLALNMYHEARGEGKIGMLMVGHVTMNRVNDDRYPKTICEVVYQPNQFSWVKTIKNYVPKDQESWELAQELAISIINRDFDRSNGALYFHNHNITPSWSKSKKIQKINKHKNHIFYAMND